ncbi:MAG: helix-turn-helix domain-containing protein, partial [Deltaproteobacteria bacterium]|nr:helix-turn-helix domain-containing protein [Deltaproteobacteria bacterium]
MKKYIVTLTANEREMLGVLISKGKHRSQKIVNALILLGCDEGKFQKKRSLNKEIAKVLNVSMKKIDRVKKRFVEDGLDITLNGRKGSRIYVKKADGDFEAHLVALSCSDPPDGFARWSLRLKGVSTSLSYPLYVVVDHLSPTDDLSSRNVLNMDSLLD